MLKQANVASWLSILTLIITPGWGCGTTPEHDDSLPPSEANSEKSSEGPEQQAKLIEGDFDWHNIFGGQYWRITGSSLEAEVYNIEAVGQPLVEGCLASYGSLFLKWADHYQIKAAQLFATAMTESACRQLADSSDGLSSGIMQVTGRTCNNLLRIYDPARVFNSDMACKFAMADSADLSVELAAMYIADSYQRDQTKVEDSDEFHLDPIKVAAGYNAGRLLESQANDWHLQVTGNHLDRYADAYNGYVNYGTAVDPEDLALQQPTWSFNPNLPMRVRRPADLMAWSAYARQGDAIFVGSLEPKVGEYYFFMNETWMDSTGEILQQ